MKPEPSPVHHVANSIRQGERLSTVRLSSVAREQLQNCLGTTTANHWKIRICIRRNSNGGRHSLVRLATAPGRVGEPGTFSHNGYSCRSFLVIYDDSEATESNTARDYRCALLQPDCVFDSQSKRTDRSVSAFNPRRRIRDSI